MDQKTDAILAALKASQGPMTAAQIAYRTGFSEKTIRNAITDWNTRCTGGPQIISGRDGYEINNDGQPFTCRQPDEPPLESMLLQLLLDSVGPTRLEDLADQLYVSLSTVSRLLKTARKYLAEYELDTEAVPRKGIRVRGKELNRRLCLMHIAIRQNSPLEALLQGAGLSASEWDLLVDRLFRILKDQELEISDDALNNLLTHILFSLGRIRSGKTVEKIPLFSGNTDSDRTLICQKTAAILLEAIQELTGLLIPEAETDYLTLHLLTKSTMLPSNEIRISEWLLELLDEVLEKIRTELGLTIPRDLELTSLLAIHTEAMLARMLFHTRLDNPLLGDIQKQYPDAFDCAVIMKDEIRLRYSLECNDDELGYLALHFASALEALRHSRRKRILVVCGSGTSTALLLQRKVEQEFHVSRDDMTVCGSFRLEEQDLSDYDMIVTSVPLQIPASIPVLLFENLTSFTPIAPAGRTGLKEFLVPNLIFVRESFKSRQEVLSFLTKEVTAHHHLDPVFAAEVWKREELSATDIGPSLALPHAYSLCTPVTVMAVCTLKKPVLWHSRKVKFIFLISYARKDLNRSHDLNEELMAKIFDTAWLQELDRCRTPEEVLGLF